MNNIIVQHHKDLKTFKIQVFFTLQVMFPLVGGLEHCLFSPIVGIMIQSDELIFFRGVGIAPISSMMIYSMTYIA